MQEGTTLRLMMANRPYGDIYDFYNISPEYFGYHHIHIYKRNRSHVSALPIPVVWLSCQSSGSQVLKRIHQQPYQNLETLVWLIQHAVQIPLGETPD
jgi:hypothetical protein